MPSTSILVMEVMLISMDLPASAFLQRVSYNSVATFAAGSYTLSFLLGGNARGAPDKTTEVFLGSDLIASITLASGDPLSLYNYSFTTSGGALSFLELGPSDQKGNILDEVTLSAPEPATLGLLGTELIGLDSSPGSEDV